MTPIRRRLGHTYLICPCLSVLWTHCRNMSTSWTYPARRLDDATAANLKELGYGE